MKPSRPGEMYAPHRRGALSQLPWRGLGAALCVSLIAHCAVLNAPASLYSIKPQTRLGAASLQTRMLDAVTIPPQASLPIADSQSSPQKPSEPAPKRPSKVDEPPKLAMSAPEPALPLVAQREPVQLQDASADADTSAAQVTLAGFAGHANLSASLQFPSSTSLTYRAVTMQKGQSHEASGLLTWKTDGQNYELQISSSQLGVQLLSWTSVGRITEAGLAPQRFADRRVMRSERATHFRADIGKIQFSNNRPEAPLLPGAQDRASVLLQLSGVLHANAERLAKGDQISVQVANADLAETWALRFEGAQEIVVPAGRFMAYKFARQARQEFDRDLQVWLAPQVQYMPVRILQSSPSSPTADYFELALDRLP